MTGRAAIRYLAAVLICTQLLGCVAMGDRKSPIEPHSGALEAAEIPYGVVTAPLTFGWVAITFPVWFAVLLSDPIGDEDNAVFTICVAPARTSWIAIDWGENLDQYVDREAKRQRANKLLHAGVDAACDWGSGSGMFFVGDEGLRWEHATDQPSEWFPTANEHLVPGLDGAPDAALEIDRRTVVVFQEDRWWRVDVAARQILSSGRIADDWPGLFEQDLDAAVRWDDQTAFFFKNDRFVCWDMQEAALRYGPLPVAHHWRGLPGELDAAYRPPGGFAYFFHGREYTKWRVDPAETSGGELANRPGSFQRLDAALGTPGDQAYFFRAGRYARWSKREQRAAAGHPKDLSTFWPGLPDIVDAALHWEGQEVIFFVGSEYVRWDLDRDLEVARGRVAEDWPGLFESIDAACSVDDQAAFFFSGDQFLCWDKESGRIRYGPYPIAEYWQGLPFERVDAACYLSEGHYLLMRGGQYVDWLNGTPEQRRSIDEGWPVRP